MFKLNQSKKAPPSNDDEVATNIFRYLHDYARYAYEEEIKRENSILQQASNMQTAFSFVITSVFIIAQIVIEYRSGIPLEFLLIVFSSITCALLLSLFYSTCAQKRMERSILPTADWMRDKMNREYDCFKIEVEQHKYIIKLFDNLRESCMKNNEKRVRLVRKSMDCFYVALALCCFGFVISIIIIF